MRQAAAVLMGCNPVQSSLLQPSAALESQQLTRAARLCREAVRNFALDLRGLKVLTEAATGPYAATAVLAALAGADEVIAVARSSRWGGASDAIAEVRALADASGCPPIRFESGAAADLARGCDLVTNTGFVRPINYRLISTLSPAAAIALMWEPWEFRPEDIDATALQRCGVPLVGTNESHPLIRTLDYLGPAAARLLLETGVEIVGSKLLVVGSDPFGSALRTWFQRAGGHVCSTGIPDDHDAVVYAEHRSSIPLFEGAEQAWRVLRRSGAPVIRIAGPLDLAAANAAGVAVVPSADIAHGVMAVTTAYAGPRPVIQLHAGGLRAAADVVRARQGGATIDEAVSAAEVAGFGARCDLPRPTHA